ncbi:hypothetical protein HDV03_001562 [Kappamyces sp. JEL0829]|nr:hypothetical protein HDV03_001562 [Kappamyces sp. JEL0829]
MSRVPSSLDNYDVVLDNISLLMASLSKTAIPPRSVLDYDFAQAGSIQLQEVNITHSALDIGQQTWSAGVILADLIDCGDIPVRDREILELGSGTGLVGLVAARLGARSVVMTDHLDAVITNGRDNICRNIDESTRQCIHYVPLDWNWFSGADAACIPRLVQRRDWPIVLAADCILNFENAKMVPLVLSQVTSCDPNARVHCVLSHRLQRVPPILAFERAMVVSKINARHLLLLL